VSRAQPEQTEERFQRARPLVAKELALERAR
jgi:hypothetical protein